MMSLDVVEGYVDVPFFQLGVVLQVLEDFRHHFITEVRITEHFKGRYVRPEEVSISVIHVMRTLRGGKNTFFFKCQDGQYSSYYGHILIGVKDVFHRFSIFAKEVCHSRYKQWHEAFREEFRSEVCLNSDCWHLLPGNQVSLKLI